LRALVIWRGFDLQLVSTVFGLLAWVLVRYRFPGRSLIDAVVGPFAFATAVCELHSQLSMLQRLDWRASRQDRPSKSLSRHLGVVFVLTIVPFVVRTVPRSGETERDIEEAAALLGASRLRTVFQVVPAHVYQYSHQFAQQPSAQHVGEYEAR
jgi:sulfate transport system permease protein